VCPKPEWYKIWYKSKNHAPCLLEASDIENYSSSPSNTPPGRAGPGRAGPGRAGLGGA
jgi:hypothetical protein